jgi:hypothetical protein
VGIVITAGLGVIHETLRMQIGSQYTIFEKGWIFQKVKQTQKLMGPKAKYGLSIIERNPVTRESKSL